ncbi:MAG: hypothetical protein KBS66_02605 [Eubacterium sp.]|nr:hypothetical protein [Candidatus Colimonas fimequi]
MKKILTLMVAICMASVMFLTGCASGNSEEGALDEILEETYTGLTGTFSDDSANFSMVEDYVSSWAKAHDIEVVATGKHCMVLKNKATEGIKADKLALHVAVDTNDMTSSTQPLAVALTSLVGPEEHGTLKLIITETTAEGFLGSEVLADKHIAKMNELISINQRKKPDLKIGGSYAFDAKLHRKVEYQEPTYTNAYEIKMTIENYKDSFDYTAKYPNPIDIVGSYLATNQSSGKLFQLASFDCKVSECGTPYSATAVVVIDDNNVESMKKKFDKAFEKLEKKCDKIEADFVYTMSETTLPEKVLTHESSASIISMLYTIDTGIFYQDEESGDIISANAISNIKLKGSNFTLNMTGRSKTADSLKEMNSALRTTAGLCDVDYEPSEVYTTWKSNEDMANFFMEAMSQKPEEDHTTLLTSDLNILTKKKPDLNCILYSISDDNDKALMHNIIHYIRHLAGTEETE